MEREKVEEGQDHVRDGAGGREWGAHAVCQEEEQDTPPSTERRKVEWCGPELGCSGC